MKKPNPKSDKAVRVARKLMAMNNGTLRIAGWVFREDHGIANLREIHRWFLVDLVAALRQAGVKGR